jgi:hypothetical protein
MNFRTTLLLLVVLIAAGVLYFVLSSNEPKTEVRTDDESGQQQTTGTKLIPNITTAGVDKVVVASPKGGKPPLVLERAGASDWRMRSPIDAPADSFKVEDLIREVLELRTTGRTSSNGKGFDPPQYVVELTGSGGNTARLQVGNSSPVSDMLYVKLDGTAHGDADIVSASIVAQLEKTASDYRKNRLLPGVNNEDIEAVTITHGDQTLKLKRVGNTDWDILEPKAMPGDTAQISSLLSSITGLGAVKFVSEDAKDIAKYGLDAPQMTIALTTTPPSTKPSTSTSQTQPAAGGGGNTTTVRFGEPSDFSKKNVYAVASEKGPVVTVEATALEALKKKPLDLRNREVLDLDANRVSRISIAVDKPATTQPTTRPAEKREVVLERRSDSGAAPTTAPAGAPAPAAAPAPQPQSNATTPDGEATVQLAAFQEPAEPAKPTGGPSAPTVPATAPAATTQPAAATQPAKPQTKWVVTSDPKGDANDANVQSLLTALRPLRAEKFLDAPATRPASVTTYVVKIKTNAFGDEPAKEHVLTITDPGGEAKLTGHLDGLNFELDRGIIEHLTAEFGAPKLEPAGPALPAGLPAFPGPAAPK